MSAVVLEHILCGVLCVCVCVCMCVLGGAVLGGKDALFST